MPGCHRHTHATVGLGRSWAVAAVETEEWWSAWVGSALAGAGAATATPANNRLTISEALRLGLRMASHPLLNTRCIAPSCVNIHRAAGAGKAVGANVLGGAETMVL